MEEESKKYEISLMLRSEEAAEAVFMLVKNQGGEVLETSPLQKIKLAYPIKKEVSALFLTMVARLAPEKVSALDQSFRLLPDALRFLIITPPILKEERSERPAHYTKPKSELHLKIEAPKESKPVAPAEPEVLTNELLEKKLEEILG
ncbi:MAG: 30S ribosomal protein S6 [bacterium]|nr:30S ribosomal protein S6 [bacterium]